MYQGLLYIVVIIIFSFFYNVLKFFELKTVYVGHFSNDSFLSTNATFAETAETRWYIKQLIPINLYLNFFLSWRVDLQFTELRKNPIYINSYICCQTFFMGEHKHKKLLKTSKHFLGIFPTLTLGILNYKIMKAMKRATTRHNNISTVERRLGLVVLRKEHWNFNLKFNIPGMAQWRLFSQVDGKIWRIPAS